MKTIAVTLMLFTVIVTACSPDKDGQNAAKPNIILIMSDDVGYSDIGCFGGEVNTPNLDALASNGLRFTQFYNTSRCCPTRASLLTGLYPHQAGVGHMMNERGAPPYQGDLNNHCLTIAQVMKLAGYDTYMAGKWHVTPLLPSREAPSRHNWPLQRGFDRFFGTIHGAGSFYDPNSLTSGNEFITPTDGFYYTDAISDTAVQYINEHSSDQPFFMYIAYTAAHWPMHALPEDIAKYEGCYSAGWEALRAERYQRMLDMGLIKPEWAMSTAYPGKKWEDEENKAFHERCMEVYAAMLDNMDRGIGRIVASLKDKGQLDNTLIFYLQDNGACAEQFGFGQPNGPPDGDSTLHPMQPDEFQVNMVPQYTRDGKWVRRGFGVMPGPSDTYVGYAENWANASNTPFRMFKHWSQEGGISTPLIVHWPDGFEERGVFRNQPGHLIDIMATCVDVSGAVYPEVYADSTILPMEGKSLLPAFHNNEIEREAIYWEHEGNRAVRVGKWKLVNVPYSWPHELDSMDSLSSDLWELYDMEADRTETRNLATQYPEKVDEMAGMWQRWAERAGAVPKPPKMLGRGQAINSKPVLN